MSNIKLINASESLSSDDFNEMELRFGVIFPESLKRHYLRVNGGIPDGYKMYYVPRGASPADYDEITFCGFYPIKYKNHPKQSTLEDSYAEFGEHLGLFDPRKYIPFGFDVSGFPLIMDFDGQKIHLLNRDVTDGDGDEVIEFVADSLDDFIDGLIDDGEYEDNL
ncbi:SMI1/KNR4 family protein [Burkholderia stagnalis]